VAKAITAGARSPIRPDAARSGEYGSHGKGRVAAAAGAAVYL